MANKMILSVRKQLSDLKELFLKYKWLASLLLIIIGLLSLVSLLMLRNYEIILLTIGATFIASGITTFIFFPMEKDIVNTIHNDITTTLNTIHNDVTTTYHLAKDYDECGIRRIFYNRSDKSFEDELEKHFKGSKILMMGTTTVGEFFGLDPLHIELFEEALKNGTEFEIILLYPCSDAARYNAVVEQKDSAYEKDEFYSKSQTYLNLKEATQYFCRIAEKVAEKEQIKVWYTKKLTPMLFIKTDSFTFIELYAMRDLESLPKGRVLQKHRRIKGSHGGYTPIFLIENYSDFAGFAKSYFEEIKKGSRSLKKVAKELRIDCGYQFLS